MSFKTIIRFLIVGGLVGGMLSTWLAPKVIAWYFSPPVAFGVTCTDPIKWAMARLQFAQLAGTIGGAILFLLLYFAFRRRENPPQLQPLEPS